MLYSIVFSLFAQYNNVLAELGILNEANNFQPRAQCGEGWVSQQRGWCAEKRILVWQGRIPSENNISEIKNKSGNKYNFPTCYTLVVSDGFTTREEAVET